MHGFSSLGEVAVDKTVTIRCSDINRTVAVRCSDTNGFAASVGLSNMRELEYSDTCRQIVDEVGAVTSDEEVVVLTDPLMAETARPIAAATRATGASTTMVIKPRLDAHNVTQPPPVAGALANADIAFDVGTYDIAHTDARRAGSDAGTRFVFMRAISEATLIDRMDTDYEELREVTRAVAAIQSAADTARVTDDRGTDLTVSLTGREGVPIDDGFDRGLVVLPAGKSAIAPVEGSGHGTIVVDYSIDNLGILDEPITLTVEDGLVSAIDGGTQASELERLVESAGSCARTLAEAPSIGTNRDVELTGNQATDKKKRGTMHVAIGDNITLGGTTDCDLHLDMTLTGATVSFDETTVLDSGEFLTDAVLDRAAEL